MNTWVKYTHFLFYVVLDRAGWWDPDYEDSEELENAEKCAAVADISQVYGIGALTAQNLYNAGCKSLAELREGFESVLAKELSKPHATHGSGGGSAPTAAVKPACSDDGCGVRNDSWPAAVGSVGGRSSRPTAQHPSSKTKSRSPSQSPPPSLPLSAASPSSSYSSPEPSPLLDAVTPPPPPAATAAAAAAAADRPPSPPPTPTRQLQLLENSSLWTSGIEILPGIKVGARAMLALASHDDLAEDVERSEVLQFRELVRNAALECIADVPGSSAAAAAQALQVDTLGGFRRGKAASHDMDFMVTHDGLVDPHPLLHAMVAKMHTLRVGGQGAHSNGATTKSMPFIVHSTNPTAKKRGTGKELVTHFTMTTGYGKNSSKGGKKNYTFDGHSRVFMIVRSEIPPYKKRRLDLIVVSVCGCTCLRAHAFGCGSCLCLDPMR